MDLNPQRVRSIEFKTAKRGLDPEEVRGFLTEVADALETAQNQSTAMEARARAAVARLQELSDGAGARSVEPSDDVAAASVEQAETISRTLLLAQRTADQTVAQAEAESQRVISAASEEAAATLDSTREMAARLMAEAREDARRVGESERLTIASEVDSLKARRDFLESDVEHLEQFLATQRGRLVAAAEAMIELSERTPGGLGAETRRPLLSASDDGSASEYASASDDGSVAAGGWASEDSGGEGSGLDDGLAADDVPADGLLAGSTDDDDADYAEDRADDAEIVEETVGEHDLTGGDARGPIGASAGVSAALDEFPPEDSAPSVADATPSAFALDDDTGEGDRGAAGGEVRFSFDERR